MKIENGKPFSSGTDYEVFLYNYCQKCKFYVQNDRGFPALVEEGGCKILDAMEFARFDVSKFPGDDIVTLKSENDSVIRFHHCLQFEKR